MAISNYPTYGLLDHWRAHTLENEWHFNQLIGKGAFLQQTPVYIREDIDLVARSIGQAFDLMTQTLHYPIVPVYTSEIIRIRAGYPAERQLHTLQWGHVQAIGRRGTTLVAAASPVTYSDVGGIRVNDTATMTATVATSIPDDQIRVFFTVTDGAPDAANQYYEITPLRRTRSGTTLTITGHRANFVKPNGLWSRPWKDPNYMDRNSGDNADASLFVTAVDIYRVYPDASAATTYRGDPFLSSSCEGCDDLETVAGCVQLIEPEIGTIMIRPEDYPSCIYPETIEVHYLAGAPLINGLPDPTLMNAAVRLTNCRMPLQPKAFNNSDRNVWADDRTATPEGVAPYLLNNPFGLRRGEVEAYREVQARVLVRGRSLSKTLGRSSYQW